MKFFDKIKNLFKRDIDGSGIGENDLVYIAKNNAKVKFGQKLDVANNCVAMLVAKNKVADVFTEGSYRLDTNNMPLLSRILKLTKPNKKGELPNSFKVDIYYINLKQFEHLPFSSLDYVVAKGKNYKNVKVGLSGNFDFCVFNAVDFMEAMFTQYGLVTDKMAKYEISQLVGTLAVRKVQKNKPNIEDLYGRASNCFEGLADYVSKELFDCGIRVSRIEVTETKFPKKIYKNVSLDYDEVKRPTNPDFQSEIPMQVETSRNEQIEKEIPALLKEGEKQITTETENASAANSNVAEANNFNEPISNQTEQKIDEANDVQSNDAQNESDVVQKTISYVQCEKCGAYNSVNAEICFNCKSKLKWQILLQFFKSHCFLICYIL